MHAIFMPVGVGVSSESPIKRGSHDTRRGSITPHKTFLLEFWPRDSNIWNVFETIADLRGVFYKKWVNSNPSWERTDENGDYFIVDVGAVEIILGQILEEVINSIKS